MNNKSSKKLQPVANLAQQNERSAARSHGSILNELKKQETQLEELITYREQYLNSFNTAARSGLSVVQMQDYRIFLLRLDDAIKQQKQNVLNGQQSREVSKDQWLDKRNHSKMIDKVIENRQKLEAEKQGKLEQRELEDRPLVKNTLS